jgi:hypothetical protein
MKLFSSMLFGLLCLVPTTMMAAETPPPQQPLPRVSIFSTSTDWEAVTGLRLSEFRIKFLPDSKIIKNGLELYYLDGFPCYGQPDRTQIWLGANGKTDRDMIITCLYVPKTITLAWRLAPRDALQNTTTGMMECPISDGSELIIDLSECTKGKDWKEFR